MASVRRATTERQTSLIAAFILPVPSAKMQLGSYGSTLSDDT